MGMESLYPIKRGKKSRELKLTVAPKGASTIRNRLKRILEYKSLKNRFMHRKQWMVNLDILIELKWHYGCLFN